MEDTAHENGRAGSGAKKLGAVVSFHDLTYTVQVQPPGQKPCSSKTVDKDILKNINGIFRPGQMSAIMGATGSGKTSLLDVLARRKDPKGVKGQILIDGKKQPSNFKCKSGYVVQDDVVMGTLTVKENFMFSANLRLPKTVSDEEKKRMVEETINELGLAHVADSKVGTEFIRGVSGGERKRTNIGMELIISPSVLFLDEPTTGLDASTAHAVMELLHRLARRGRTIILSIHQPRYSIFKLFDRLVLLSRGHMVYQGPSMDALEYFSTIGYECEAHNNPPDFFLDIINGDSSALKKANGKQVEYDNGTVSVEIKDDDSKEADDTLARELSDQFKQSTWHQTVNSDVQQILQQKQIHDSSDNNGKDEEELPYGGYSTSLLNQLYVVGGRMVKNIIRNPIVTVIQVLLMVFFGIVTGLIFLDVNDTITTGIQNRTGAFFFIVMNLVFGNLSALEIFIAERSMFIHENSNGFYSCMPYFLSKVFYDLIPLRVIPMSCFGIITYFMIGFVSDAGKFFIYVFTLVLTSVTAASLSFFYSAMFRTFAVANISIAFSYVIMMVFGGFLVDLDSIVVWLEWLKYFSIFWYSMNALYITEFKDLELCEGFFKNGTGYGCNPDAGNEFLELMDIDYKNDWDLWKNILALIIMTTGFLALTYISLRRINKYK